MLMINDCRYHLIQAGIAMPDAEQLRRIAMTLHRWHELECGDGNAHGSWSIVRGRKTQEVLAGGAVRHGFEYAEDGTTEGKPFLEYHSHNENEPHYYPKPDAERGALKRLKAIMARYPGWQTYVQGDPRGASLYILKPGDVPAGADVASCYSRGIAVYR